MFALVGANSNKLISGICLSNKLFRRAMAKKSAILLMADGAEEMEAVITADVLRRAGVSHFFFLIMGYDIT